MAKPNNLPRAHPKTNHAGAPSPEVIERFLRIQEEELKLRTQQLAVDAQQGENNKVIAEQSIQASLLDRQQHRTHIEQKTKLFFMGFTGIIVIIALLSGFALYMGKDEIVRKIFAFAIVFSAGFAGGYGIKAARTANQEEQRSRDTSQNI